MQRAIAQLSADHQEILRLAFYEDLPYAEIAALLAIPDNIVKTCVYLASMIELHRAVRSAFDAEPGPAPRVRAAVLKRIHAPNSDHRVSWPVHVAAWLRAPVVPRWAPAAALLLIVIQGAAFNPLALAAQMRELLDALGARIVDGPAATGAYVIELAPP